MAAPQSRFTRAAERGTCRAADLSALSPDRTGEDWVARKVGPNGVICVSWQQVSVGRPYAAQRCDVHVGRDLLQVWVDAELLKIKDQSADDCQASAEGPQAHRPDQHQCLHTHCFAGFGVEPRNHERAR